ncbi:MAG: hypothetical protein H0W62_13465 [Chitinophagales bacterium]|nr:hypothetical protein [Chitinophagales bacterium]
MEKLTLIKEIAENLKDLPVAFRYLNEVKNYREGVLNQEQPPDETETANWKPFQIDRYQTSRYMQTGAYYKPISRIFLPKQNDQSPELI